MLDNTIFYRICFRYHIYHKQLVIQYMFRLLFIIKENVSDNTLLVENVLDNNKKIYRMKKFQCRKYVE